MLCSDVLALWRFLCKGPQPDQQTCGVEVYTAPDGVGWLHDDEERRLLVRDRVRRVWDFVVRHNASRTGRRRTVVVLGTPGIGKSWTLNYFLLCLARDKLATAIVVHLAWLKSAWVIKVGQGATQQSVEFVRHDDVQYIEELKQTDTWYLYDPDEGASMPCVCNGMTIVTSSPNPKHFKNVEKRPSGETAYAFVSVPSLGELVAMRPHISAATACTEEVLRHNFSICGGVVRYVFGEPDRAVKHVQDGVQNCTLQQLQALLNQFSAGGIEEDAQAKGKWVHRLLHGFADPANPNSVDKVSVSFATKHAARQVFLAVEAREYDTLSRFMRSVIERTGGVRMLSYEVWVEWLFARRPDRTFRFTNYTLPQQGVQSGGEQKDDVRTLDIPVLSLIEAGKAADLVMSAVAQAMVKGVASLVCPTSDTHEANDHYAVFPLPQSSSSGVMEDVDDGAPAKVKWLVLMLQDTNASKHSYHPWKLVSYAEAIRQAAPNVEVHFHYCLVAPPNAKAGLCDPSAKKNRGNVSMKDAKAAHATVHKWGMWYFSEDLTLEYRLVKRRRL